MPVFAAGTAPTTASVAGAMTQPIARVSPKNHGTSVSALVCGSQKMVVASRSARPISPAATTRAVPSRRTTLLDEPAPIIRPSAIGLITAPLPPEERAEERDARPEQPDHAGAAPAELGRLDDRVHEDAEAGRRERGAQEIE